MAPTVISQQLKEEGLYHSQLTQKSQGEATPQSTLTTVMRKVCTTVSPHKTGTSANVCRGGPQQAVTREAAARRSFNRKRGRSLKRKLSHNKNKE
jgi:hypothetical protein